jgi:hypothetical protein
VLWSRNLAGGTRLAERSDLKEQAYVVPPLPDGDFIVRVRHVISNEICITSE